MHKEMMSYPQTINKAQNQIRVNFIAPRYGFQAIKIQTTN